MYEQLLYSPVWHFLDKVLVDKLPVVSCFIFLKCIKGTSSSSSAHNQVYCIMLTAAEHYW